MAGFPAELSGGGPGDFGVPDQAKVVVHTPDQQGKPPGDDQEFSMLAEPGESLKQALDVFELVVCILAELFGAAGDVLATQLLGDDGEVVDRVAPDVGAVDLPQEVTEDQRITPGVGQLRAVNSTKPT